VSLTVDPGRPSEQTLTGTLSGGSAVFTIPGLPDGAHPLNATYNGVAPWLPSSATGSVSVGTPNVRLTPRRPVSSQLTLRSVQRSNSKMPEPGVS
jgi:hypothetical protein